jgi:hypothetical protein
MQQPHSHQLSTRRDVQIERLPSNHACYSIISTKYSCGIRFTYQDSPLVQEGPQTPKLNAAAFVDSTMALGVQGIPQKKALLTCGSENTHETQWRVSNRQKKVLL